MCAILDFELNPMREIQHIFITVRSKIDSKHSSARYAEAARSRSVCTTTPSRNFPGALEYMTNIRSGCILPRPFLCEYEGGAV
jgi:hypothetical protein